MSSIEKLKRKFYASPVPNDISIEEIIRLANYYECEVLTGGNHQIRIANKKNGMLVPLPQHDKGIKPPYIKELRKLFDDEEN